MRASYIGLQTDKPPKQSKQQTNQPAHADSIEPKPMRPENQVPLGTKQPSLPMGGPDPRGAAMNGTEAVGRDH